LEARDVGQRIVERIQLRAVGGAVDNSVRVRVDDIYRRGFSAGSFPLAVSLGVIACLQQPERAITELSRIVQPGGYLLLTADNDRRLSSLLDPWTSPALTPVKNWLKRLLRRGQRSEPANEG